MKYVEKPLDFDRIASIELPVSDKCPDCGEKSDAKVRLHGEDLKFLICTKCGHNMNLVTKED